jgi:hypothetical protein
MLFRVVLASVLLLCAISLVLSQGNTESFGRAFAQFLFGLLGLAYAVTLVYALVLPRIKHLVHFAYLQIGVDLVLIGALVHATGGAQSAFTILFMIQVIAVALLPERYGAAWVAAASTLLVILVSLAGIRPAAAVGARPAGVRLGAVGVGHAVPAGAERRRHRHHGGAGPEPQRPAPARRRAAGPPPAIRRRPGIVAPEHHPLPVVGAGDGHAGRAHHLDQ